MYNVSQKSNNTKCLALRSADLHRMTACTSFDVFGLRPQILYKSIVPFSRFSTVMKHCQKVQLLAALLTCFLCVLTVFCTVGSIRVQFLNYAWKCWTVQ